MKPFSPKMFPHRLKLLALSESRDPASGVVEGFPDPATVAALPCRVRYVATHPGGSGGESEASTTTAAVAFPADPGAKKGDRLLVAPAGAVLRALGSAKARDADGVLFVVPCEVVE